MEKSSILKTVQELLPLLILTAVSTVLGYYGSLLALFLMLIVFLFRKHIEGNIELYANKTLLTVFCIVYAILMMHTLLISFGIYEVLRLDAENVKVLVKAAGVVLSIILLRITNISVKNFSWTLSKGQILGTITIAAAFICITVVFDGLRFINDFNGDIAKFSLYVLKILVLVAFFEEFLCRGILISALKAYSLSEWKINLIQAFLFGILHYARYIERGIGLALLTTSYQIVIGYFFGKLYFKTKTLTPGIILHLLWDIV